MRQTVNHGAQVTYGHAHLTDANFYRPGHFTTFNTAYICIGCWRNSTYADFANFIQAIQRNFIKEIHFFFFGEETVNALCKNVSHFINFHFKLDKQ